LAQEIIAVVLGAVDLQRQVHLSISSSDLAKSRPALRPSRLRYAAEAEIRASAAMYKPAASPGAAAG
jgi:hypothetical protein